MKKSKEKPKPYLDMKVIDFLSGLRKNVLLFAVTTYLNDAVNGETSNEHIKTGMELGLWKSLSNEYEIKSLYYDCDFICGDVMRKTRDSNKRVKTLVFKIAEFVDEKMDSYVKKKTPETKRLIESLIKKKNKTKEDKIFLRFILRISSVLKELIDDDEDTFEMLFNNNVSYIG